MVQSKLEISFCCYQLRIFQKCSKNAQPFLEPSIPSLDSNSFWPHHLCGTSANRPMEKVHPVTKNHGKDETGSWTVGALYTSRCPKRHLKWTSIRIFWYILMHPIGFPDFQWVSSITRLHDGSTSQHHRTWFRAGGVASRLGVQAMVVFHT